MIIQSTVFLCSIPHLQRGRVYSATPLPLSCVSIVQFVDCMGRHLRRIRGGAVRWDATLSANLGEYNLGPDADANRYFQRRTASHFALTRTTPAPHGTTVAYAG